MFLISILWIFLIQIRVFIVYCIFLICKACWITTVYERCCINKLALPLRRSALTNLCAVPPDQEGCPDLQITCFCSTLQVFDDAVMELLGHLWGVSSVWQRISVWWGQNVTLLLWVQSGFSFSDYLRIVKVCLHVVTWHQLFQQTLCALSFFCERSSWSPLSVAGRTLPSAPPYAVPVCPSDQPDT